MSQKLINTHKHITQTLSLTSGKGGVGKTTLVTNLAYSLSSQGKSALILDGDLGMANVDIMFGIRSRFNIKDVLMGECSFQDAIVRVRPGVDVIPGGSGVYGLSRLDSYQRQCLLDQVSLLDQDYDVMLIDTAPGIDDTVLHLNAAAQEIMVILTPDPSSLADVYALIKVLNQRHHEHRFSILCNLVRDEAEAVKIFQRLSDICAKFLCVSLDYKGHVPLDTTLGKATKMQQLVVETSPGCPSGLAIRNLAKKVSNMNEISELKGGMQFFWQHLSGVA